MRKKRQKLTSGHGVDDVQDDRQASPGITKLSQSPAPSRGRTARIQDHAEAIAHRRVGHRSNFAEPDGKEPGPDGGAVRLAGRGDIAQHLKHRSHYLSRHGEAGEKDGGQPIDAARLDEGVLVNCLVGAEVSDEAEAGDEDGRGGGGEAAEDSREGSVGVEPSAASRGP